MGPMSCTHHRMLPTAIAGTMLCTLISAGGCQSHSNPWDNVEHQDRSMREVRGRVADLRQNMTEQQVLLVLGEPASREKGVWTWVDQPPTSLQPAHTLELVFENGQLHDWTFDAVEDQN